MAKRKAKKASVRTKRKVRATLGTVVINASRSLSSGAYAGKLAKAPLRKRKSLSTPLTVSAAWDAEAAVWYIASSDLRGLHLEGATSQELFEQLPGAIGDLLEGSGQQEVSFAFITPDRAVTPGRVKIAA
jgi:predicted RNase H-like HicB family nuclease